MKDTMRILLHDYGHYPFTAELAASLAQRGHVIEYAFCGDDTPRGDPDANLNEVIIHAVNQKNKLDKGSFRDRYLFEKEHGRLLAIEALRFKPDIVISADAPLDAQSLLLRECRTAGIPFVYWLQDLLSIAISRIVRQKLGAVGSLIGARYTRLEKSMLRQSSCVIAITEDFRPRLEQWGVDRNRTHVIENWAPLHLCPLYPRNNAWSAIHGGDEHLNIIYSGTMGMKHNPELFVKLSQALGNELGAKITVISEGVGAQWLKVKNETERLTSLEVLPFQPFDQLPQVLATADILIAILEPDAGVYSVPSKVLTYLCAGRPLLLAVPQENLAARIVREVNAGIVVSPDDVDGLVAGARKLLSDPSLRKNMGENARKYAESHYNIAHITDRWESILQDVMNNRPT